MQQITNLFIFRKPHNWSQRIVFPKETKEATKRAMKAYVKSGSQALPELWLSAYTFQEGEESNLKNDGYHN